MIAGVLGERTLEQEHVQNLQEVPESALRPPSASVSCENSAAFQQSRRLFGQFGQLLWEKRSKIQLVKKVTYSPFTYKCHKSNIKNLLMKSSEIVFIFLPAFYLIIWLMTSPKNFKKITILKI